MDELAKIPKGILIDESGYPFTGIEAPDWVEELDSFFAGRDIRLITNPLFRTSANLCRRIGDHDLYSQWLENALSNHPSPWWSAAFATSLLVGYFSTGKSLPRRWLNLVESAFWPVALSEEAGLLQRKVLATHSNRQTLRHIIVCWPTESLLIGRSSGAT